MSQVAPNNAKVVFKGRVTRDNAANLKPASAQLKKLGARGLISDKQLAKLSGKKDG